MFQELKQTLKGILFICYCVQRRKKIIIAGKSIDSTCPQPFLPLRKNYLLVSISFSP
jgi:hypothetical protein